MLPLLIQEAPTVAFAAFPAAFPASAASSFVSRLAVSPTRPGPALGRWAAPRAVFRRHRVFRNPKIEDLRPSRTQPTGTGNHADGALLPHTHHRKRHQNEHLGCEQHEVRQLTKKEL